MGQRRLDFLHPVGAGSGGPGQVLAAGVFCPPAPARRGPGPDPIYLRRADTGGAVGRSLYALGRTPRKGIGWYQRKYSPASRLGAGMVDWRAALEDCLLFHTSGITFGLANHSGYEQNYLQSAFVEAVEAKPSATLVCLDFNFRATLWSPEHCRQVMTTLVQAHVDVLTPKHGQLAPPVGSDG